MTRVPDWVKNGIRIDMLSQLEKKDSMQASQIGFDFMRFCSKWELYAIADRAQDYISLLSK